MIRAIEELSLNAWPAMQSLQYDGWVLRCADGYTKRANSVYPLYPSQLDVDEKIDFCESFYRNRGLPAVFKLTRASTPTHLDAFLEKRGYRMDSLTSVQCLDLSAGEYGSIGNVDLTSTDSEVWHAAFARMNNVSPDRQTIHEHILRAILPDKCYAALSVDGHIIGCGLGVLQSGYIGIFDIVIAPDHREQGHGMRLMQALLAWGQGHSAHTSYLQVMSNNESALGLYERLGFRETYQYWYRIG